MATKKLRTRWTPPRTLAAGKAVAQMVKAHRKQLALRGLDDPFIDAFYASLRNLEDVLTGRVTNRNALKSRTRNQADLWKEARARVVAIRGAIQDVHGGNKAMHIAFGVGNPRTINSLATALEAIDAISRGFTLYRSAAEAAYVVQADIDDLEQLRQALIGSEEEQETAKGDRKMGTHGIASAARVVESYIDRSHAAARLAFAGQPEVLAKFLDPIPSESRKGKTTPKPSPEEPVE